MLGLTTDSKGAIMTILNVPFFQDPGCFLLLLRLIQVPVCRASLQLANCTTRILQVVRVRSTRTALNASSIVHRPSSHIVKTFPMKNILLVPVRVALALQYMHNRLLPVPVLVYLYSGILRTP
jgi:hypothetical protein